MKERLRIAIVSEPGYFGVKAHVVDLLTAIDLDRFEIHYYYSIRRIDGAYAAELEAIRARGIHCVELPMDDGLGFLANLRVLRTLIGHLRRFRPAILHLHSSKAGGLGRLASLFIRPRPKVIFTPHAMACYRSRVYLWMERILGFLHDDLVAVSPSEKQDFIRWRIPGAARAEVIRLGVRPAAAASADETGPTQMWTVGACGRINYQKNALLFFKTALQMISLHKDYRFRWIGDFGDDAEAQAARALLDKAGRPRGIEVTGWVPDPQTQIAKLNIFCMFSRYESFGYVTAEAMLLGVPVLATPASGTVDLIWDEETGLLVKPSTDDIMIGLGRLHSDPLLRDRLAGNARRLIGEQYTVKQMVDSVEALYLKAQSER